MLHCTVRNHILLTFRMASSTDNGEEAGDEKKAAKLECLKGQRKKKMAKEARLKRFRNTVNPISMCVSRVDVEGLVRTKDDFVERIVRYTNIFDIINWHLPGLLNGSSHLVYSRKFFQARNYGEVIAKTKEVHKELKTLGCFRAGSLQTYKGLST